MSPTTPEIPYPTLASSLTLPFVTTPTKKYNRPRPTNASLVQKKINDDVHHYSRNSLRATVIVDLYQLLTCTLLSRIKISYAHKERVYNSKYMYVAFTNSYSLKKS